MEFKIILGIFLILGMLLTSTTVAGVERGTHIEIESTPHYDPDTAVYTGYMSNAGDNDDDIVVRAKTETGNIASDDIVFELWELENIDMNNNGVTGEKLYETAGITQNNDRRWTNFANWFFASENIPKVYRNKNDHTYTQDLDAVPQPNLPTNGDYLVKIKYQGVSGVYKISRKTIHSTNER